MHFESPWWLLTLVGVVVLLVGYVLIQLRRRRFVARFSNTSLLASVAPRRPGWRRHLTFALLMIGLVVLSIGVARPTGSVKVPRDRATVMVAVDVSLSMEATDVLPSRIQAAKDAATNFLDLLPPQINVGLVKFAGAASVVVSPTLDRDSLKTAVNNLQLGDSTAIGDAVVTSLDAISTFGQSSTANNQKPPPARIVLMSDGTSNMGVSVSSAATQAKKADVPVSTIAFGTLDGTVTIDGQQEPVPPNIPSLRGLAESTGGSFHAAASAEALKSVFKDIGSQIGYTTEQRDISYRFLAVGLLVAMAAAASSLLWAGRLS